MSGLGGRDGLTRSSSCPCRWIACSIRYYAAEYENEANLFEDLLPPPVVDYTGRGNLDGGNILVDLERIHVEQILVAFVVLPAS